MRGTVCTLQSLQAGGDLSAAEQAALAALLDLGPLRPLERSPPDSPVMTEVCAKTYEELFNYLYFGRNPMVTADNAEMRAQP